MTSAAYRSQLNARTMDKQIIGLMHIAHGDLDPVEFPNNIRLCDADANVTSNAIDYIAWPFRWRRPDKRSNRLPQIPVEIDNVDPKIMNAIIALTSPPIVTIWTIMEDSLDTIEEGPMEFDLQGVEDDPLTIQAMLGMEPVLWMGSGRYSFNPKYFPGAFR